MASISLASKVDCPDILDARDMGLHVAGFCLLGGLACLVRLFALNSSTVLASCLLWLEPSQVALTSSVPSRLH